jgi:G3E family GTPase
MVDLPVTVVAGYLGSGKTTYINQQLAQANGLRYAVLVNDFGELNIDAELIESETATSISLVNGCVCCSIAGDMDGALEEIRSIADSLDWVMLEASGVADPGRVKNMVLNWPGFELKELITLVDATRIRKLVNDKFVGRHIREQLSSADKLLLSKSDLLPAGEVHKVEQCVDRYAAQQKSAGITRTVRFPERQFPESHPAFYSECFVSVRPISRDRLESWLRGLDESVIRIKGFAQFDDNTDHQYLLQWVEGDWRLELLGKWRQTPQTKLVLIASNPTSVFPEDFNS